MTMSDGEMSPQESSDVIVTEENGNADVAREEAVPLTAAQEDDEDEDELDDDDEGEPARHLGEEQRMGTTASARFNILSTMVGGGSLSLPLAFQKTGNALLGPFIMIVVAAVTEFCFRIHVRSARVLSPVSSSSETITRPGSDSFESVASAAFGPKAHLFSMGLVTAMCFFGTVGYAVLLRDMLQPITDMVWQHDKNSSQSGPTLHNNITMLTVVLSVTPLCTLKTLTALEKFGAASMFSILILGSVILYRSVQCNMGDLDDDASEHHWKSFQLWPDSWKDVLDAFPLFVSCFVCHYNLLPVHNELRRPSKARVSWWLKSTVWSACTFYLVIGISGSAYGHCTATGKVQGNVLLDFDEDDPLLLVGRMCLALTLTMAFPMLTIPARDILIRSLPKRSTHGSIHEETNISGGSPPPTLDESALDDLREPLLENSHDEECQEENQVSENNNEDANMEGRQESSLLLRLVAAISVFWSAAAVASCVESIDVVWDLLGSSLSMLLSYLIPCSSYLVIMKKCSDDNGGTVGDAQRSYRLSKCFAWVLVIVSVPLMIASTANAVYDTFFHD